MKSAYQKIVIYPVLCKLVKNQGIESIGKRLPEGAAKALRKRWESVEKQQKIFPPPAMGK